MSQHDTHRDLPEPDEVGELLERALRAEGPSAAYLASLFDRLDDEFRATTAHRVPAEAPHLRNGHAKLAGPLSAALVNGKLEAVPAAADQPTRTSSVAESRRWPARRRWFAGMALAASVLVAVLLANMGPKYSWASMVEAIRTQPWVEAVVRQDGATGGRGWISWTHGVVARRSDQVVVFDNLTDGVRNRYRVDERVIYREPLAGEAPRSAEQALLDFVLYDVAPAADGVGAVNVVDESWQKVRNDKGNWIKLDVRLRVDEEPAVQAVSFLLDPESRLPMSAHLARRAGDKSREFLLSYPADGPREVHAEALGVPLDAPVEEASADRIAADDSARLATNDAAPAQRFTVEESQAPAPTAKPAPDSVTATVADDEPAEADDDQPPPTVASDEEMSRRVDESLAACWKQNGIRPVDSATDGEYLRRVYLDLTGRIPKVPEVQDFMSDPRPDRRTRLLDELLDRYDHATHLAAVWRRFLLPDGVDLSRYGGPEVFEQWLADHFRQNTPYDEIVRELLLAEGRVTEPGPLMFYTAQRLQPEELAGQSSRAFLGTRMECAQCHDHLFDDRWKQDDFWGFAAFFARMSQPESKIEMVSPVLRIQDSERGEVMLPDTDEVIPPRFPLGEDSPDTGSGPARRKRLADWLTARDNEHFARATVNRIWAHLFGKGLVDPVDDMRPDNPAQCPEVLDELATYFADSGFDLRKLIRTLALTDAYRLSSSSPEDDPSRLLYFAQMNVKTFTAEQLYDCIAVATGMDVMASGREMNSVERFNNVSRQEFLEQFRSPPGQATEYHAGIPQALTLMNGRLIESGTDVAQSGMLHTLQMPFFTDEQRLDTLFMATLSRPPSEAEQTTMMNHLASASNHTARQEAFGDILWVLLNSAEFTLNH